MRQLHAGVLLFAAILLPAGARAESTASRATEEVRIEQNLGAQLPADLVFTDEGGRRVRLGDLLGDKPVILAMAWFDCPMMCPMVLESIARSTLELPLEAGTDYEVIVVSIDPGEGPDEALSAQKDVKHRYESASADAWHFLTGKGAAIEELADTVGFRYVYHEQSGQYAHAAGLMVATPNGKLSRYFYGLDFPPRDLRLSLVEASNENIGSAVDRLLLICLQWDPTQGKYSFAIRQSLRIGALATILVIGASIGMMLRREKKNTPQP